LKIQREIAEVTLEVGVNIATAAAAGQDGVLRVGTELCFVPNTTELPPQSYGSAARGHREAVFEIDIKTQIVAEVLGGSGNSYLILDLDAHRGMEERQVSALFCVHDADAVGRKLEGKAQCEQRKEQFFHDWKIW